LVKLVAKFILALIAFVFASEVCAAGYSPFGAPSWRQVVSTSSLLPATGNITGDIIVAQDTGDVWEWNGSAWTTPPGGAGTPGGANSDVQYNSSGSFAGNANFTTDGAGNVTASTFIGALTGNASTATALASTPVQCSGSNYATGIQSSGAANCSNPVPYPLPSPSPSGEFVMATGSGYTLSAVSSGPPLNYTSSATGTTITGGSGYLYLNTATSMTGALIVNGANTVTGASSLTGGLFVGTGSTLAGPINASATTLSGSGQISTAGTVTGALFVGPLTGHASLDLPLTGGTLSGGLNLGTNQISAVVDPTTAQMAATKNYVDTQLAQLNPAAAVYAASTANITGTYTNVVGGVCVGDTFVTTSTAAFSLDGVSPSVGARVLLKNQTSTFQDGIWTLTVNGNGVSGSTLTRALDFDSSTDFNSGQIVPVVNGTANAGSSWYQTAVVSTCNSDPQTWTQFQKSSSAYFLASGGTITGATSVTGALFSSDISTGASTISGTTLSGSGQINTSGTLTGGLFTSGSSTMQGGLFTSGNLLVSSSGTISGTTLSGTGQVSTAGTLSGSSSSMTGNALANNFVPTYATTATAAGTTTLTVSSAPIEYFTGTTTQTIVLPVTSTLPKTGFTYTITNNSTGLLTVESSGGNVINTIASGQTASYTAILLTGTTAASWNSPSGLGYVAQAQWVGSVTVTGCASNWSGTNTSFANFSTQSGCSYAISGALAAPASNVPGFIIPAGAPGRYEFRYVGLVLNSNASGTNVTSYKFSDGTSNSETASIQGSQSSSGIPSIVGAINYTAPLTTNTTIQVQGLSSSATVTNGLYGTTANPGVFNVYYFPSQSQLATNPSILPANWSGYQTGNWTQTSSGSALTYTDFTTGNSPVLTSIGTPRNITCVTDATAAIPGVTCTLPTGGNYTVSANGSIADGTGVNNMLMRLTDGSGTAFAWSGYTAAPATGSKAAFNIKGQYTVANAGSVTFKLQAASDAASQALTLGTGTTQQSIVWNIEQQDALNSMPILVGGVTSTGSGQYHTESALFALSGGSCTLTSQTGSWVATAGVSTGNCNLTFTAGEFSAQPFCVATSYTINGGYATITASSATAAAATLATSSTGVGVNGSVTISCTGPH
jgi:fibronectin-binding autotransporter adhesin